MPKDSNKSHVSIVVIGHVDSGKSTTTGHLVYKCGGVDRRTIEKFEKEATEMNRASFKYAWVLDRTNQERSRGITIDCTVVQLSTEHVACTIIDAPGHKDFIKNMLSGTSQADYAVIVVPASKGEFETAIGESGCVRQQCKLAFTMGIRYAVVFVNKMDTVEYDEGRFNEITDFMLGLLKRIGFSLPQIAILPGSGLQGDNIDKPSENIKWFKEWSYTYTLPDKSTKTVKGKSLYDWFNTLHTPPREVDKDLRGTINDSFKVGGIGTVAVGRIIAGILKPNDVVHISPVEITTDVKSIEMHHQQLDQAEPGDNIGFNLKGVAARDLRRGCLFGHATKNPPKEASMFTATVMAIEKIGSDSGIREGYCPVLDVHSAHLPVKVTKIISVAHKKTKAAEGAPVEAAPVDDSGVLCIKREESGQVELTPQKPVSVESFADYAALGRFSMRDSNKTVAVGVIKSVTKKEPQAKSAAAATAAKGKAAAGAGKGKK